MTRRILGVALTIAVVLAGACTAPSVDGAGAGAAGPSAVAPVTPAEPPPTAAPDDEGEYGPDGY